MSVVLLNRRGCKVLTFVIDRSHSSSVHAVPTDRGRSKRFGRTLYHGTMTRTDQKGERVDRSIWIIVGLDESGTSGVYGFSAA
jgi:hypothetical protein